MMKAKLNTKTLKIHIFEMLHYKNFNQKLKDTNEINKTKLYTFNINKLTTYTLKNMYLLKK